MKGKLTAIEHRAISGLWLLGEDFEEITISDDTYNWLWRNIYTICDNPRLVKMFWANSYQYFDYRLDAIDEVYNDNGEVINQSEIDKRKKERSRFLELHYALGGLLLYRKQYGTIKYLLDYTQSQPPRYVLLPETMTQVFYWFGHFSNEFKHDIPIDSKYYFPELDNLGNRRQVIYWICCYIAVLFIRQYSLPQYYVYQHFTALPNLPNDVLKLGNLLESISYFEVCLKKVLTNQQLLNELNLKELAEENRENFDKFIHELRESVKEKIGREKLNAELSPEKVSRFESQTNRIITNAFESYKSVFVTKDDAQSYEDDLKLAVTGGKILMSKSSFTENDIPNLNYDTMFAEAIERTKIKRDLPTSFPIARTKRYLLNKDNIKAGLNKIIGQQENIIIVGVNINYELNEILKKSKFKDILQPIPSTANSVRNTLFVLHKSDLPAIEYQKIKETEDLQLRPINEKINLFASVIDLSKEENKAVREQWKSELKADNQDPKVQVAISFNAVIYWKKNRDIIQINIASEYREQGIPNDINDVQPIAKKEERK